jgi:protein-S-isoprenylcysteine O-methyltransferase Ste14
VFLYGHEIRFSYRFCCFLLELRWFFAVSAFAGIHFSILKEEKFLQKVYGEEYADYAAKVRRYF